MADSNTEEFFDALMEGLAGGSFVKLTLAKRRGTADGPKNVYVRPVTLKKGERLSFLYRHATRDEVKNLAAEEGVLALRGMLGAEFLSGHLFNSGEDLRLEFSRKGETRLARHAPTFAEAEPPREGHVRKKRRAVEAAGSVYLRELGVTNERGEVRPAMGDKFRQINRFVEILAGLRESSPLAKAAGLSVVDVGSGKGYLTFAVYDYLNNRAGVRADVTGVEARPPLVELCNEVARRSGFGGLRFKTGLVEDFEVGRADVLIALHACDTATDDAIYKGVAAGASVIVTAPCCHKELRPQIEAPAALRGLLRHGIILEREAESVTDSLRALLLEAAGYSVKVFEFVSTEHTRKNTMIAATLRSADADREKARALREYRELKEFYGIRGQRLERLLCGDASLAALLTE
ncbi:MAG TPA: SAM-dependent methyltransferase [Pyrinomonadaceae bacterium]|jgi:SAM-dependent methyltransferase|nr:SAM-dependent methyltransferase [Pyrinomonadaceae bacterium]